MKRIFSLATILLLTLSSQPLLASDSEEEAQASTASTENLYKPQLFGGVRVKYEQTLINGDHRFNVRNSRLGVKGYASENMSYAVQIDFNNEGKVSILDSYVAYELGDFTFSLGQQQYHFNQDLDRGPTSSLFSNRSFLSKYLTTYFSTEDNYVKTIGSRDIGAMVAYKNAQIIPLSITAGLFNGTGANNPEWTDGVNGVARLAIGEEKKGLLGAASIYKGTTPSSSSELQHIDMYGGELRYTGDNYLVEAAYAQRILETKGEENIISTAYIHGYYKFDLKKSGIVNHIAPHMRYDFGRGIEFINMATSAIDRYDANRFTIALNIGLTEKWMRSELRLAYEEYVLPTEPSDFQMNPLLQDKFTIELIAAF